MYILKCLIDFYNSGQYNWLVMLLIAWLVFPGSVYIVGAIFESRLVPVWRYQARTFFPGSLAFGVIFVYLIRIYAMHDLGMPPNYWYAWLIVEIFVGAMALVISLIERDIYPLGATSSPTKLVNNIIGYFIVPTALIGLMLTLIGLTIIDRYDSTWQDWIVIIFGWTFYTACTLTDISGGYTFEDLDMRFPDYWEPIWRKPRPEHKSKSKSKPKSKSR